MVAIATGWTPDQVWQMRPADFATVVELLTKDEKG